MLNAYSNKKGYILRLYVNETGRYAVVQVTPEVRKAISERRDRLFLKLRQHIVKNRFYVIVLSLSALWTRCWINLLPQLGQVQGCRNDFESEGAKSRDLFQRWPAPKIFWKQGLFWYIFHIQYRLYRAERQRSPRKFLGF